MKVLVTDDERCIGCHLCEDVCANAWFKEIDRRKSAIRITSLGDAEWEMSVCNQCGKCIDVCPTQAISRDKTGVVRIKKDLCTGCLSCVGFCPTMAMFCLEGALEPFKCISCGLCVKECPAEALSLVTLPD